MMPLKAGQISLHHTHIVHSSEPNRTDQRRIGRNSMTAARAGASFKPGKTIEVPGTISRGAVR